MINLTLDRTYYHLNQVIRHYLNTLGVRYDITFGYTNIEFDNLGQLKEFLEFLE